MAGTALAQPKALLECKCGGYHVPVARIGGHPVLVCPHEPANGVLRFYPSKHLLVVGPEPEHATGKSKTKPKEQG